MKIGILTYHRAYNYGAVLQCFALKEVLKSMGHEACVIDYRQSEIENFYRFKSSFSIKKAMSLPIIKGLALLLLAPIRDIKQFRAIKRKKRIFEAFQKKYLNLTAPCTTLIPQGFDYYIIGSDMLWAYDVKTNNFDPVYLGKFERLPGAKLVGYAISGTPDSFVRLGEEQNFDFLKNFDSISFREKSLADIVGSYTGKDTTCCIDPTLLTTKMLWQNLIKPEWQKKKYLVTYYLRLQGDKKNTLNNKIKKLAEEKGLEIIDINIRDSVKPISVEDFVSIICCSSYVITDSFHGVIFSLIFEKPVHALKLHDSHDARYVDILQTVGADNLIVESNFDPFIPNVEYEILNERIIEFRKESEDFLRMNL